MHGKNKMGKHVSEIIGGTVTFVSIKFITTSLYNGKQGKNPQSSEI